MIVESIRSEARRLGRSVATLREIWSRAVVVATLLAFASATFVYFGMMPDHPITFGTALREGLTDWYFWVLAAPAVFVVARRLRIDRRRWLSVAVQHLLLGSVVAVLAIAAGVAFRALIVSDPTADFWSAYQRTLLRNFHYAFMVYWMLVAATHAFLYYQEAREATELREQLVHAQLEALRTQLHPHFLFNTLHTVATLVRAGEADTAIGMLSGLSALLRSSLRAASDEVSLREELELLRAYIAIEQCRFHDRLHVAIDIDPDAQDVMVPSLILQPLVENAIRYGVGGRQHASRVDVIAIRQNAALVLEVRDDGPGFAASQERWGTGIGLTNARARLTRLYGTSCRFESGNLPSQGAFVRLQLPWRHAAEAAVPLS